MDHIAIMRPSWKLLPKIITGEKTLESRWYKNKSAPWGKIKAGDMVYFKDSGQPVRARAKVRKVKTFENLTSEKVKEILMRYGKLDGIDEKDVPHYYELFKDKKYCILVCLNHVQKVKPFNINKKGFGSMAAWICVKDTDKIKQYVK